MDTSDKKVVLITGGAMGQGQTHAVEFAKKAMLAFSWICLIRATSVLRKPFS